MNFTEIAEKRQSCRSYDSEREIEAEKLDKILTSARLAPSACNGQPYKITVCRGDAARRVAKATQGMGLNKFAPDAPVLLVISEMPYVASAALGAKVKKNDYRSIDIGIVSAYITAEAAAQGIGSCILGWLDDAEIRKICSLDGAVRLVITLGYAREGDKVREKKRKPIDELVAFVESHPDECGDLEVVEIPDTATDWEIDEYDGWESVVYVVNGKLHHA
jgi:nitroreductase